MSNTLSTQLEALLFFKGEPMKKSALLKALQTNGEALSEAIDALRESLTDRGITLVEDGDTIALGTAPEVHTLIESVRRDELEGPLGKAGLETLAIIMYQGPVSRADIEYVRGVNCSSILRSLTTRGLIERKENPRDKRGYRYQSCAALPAHLGITAVEHMPEYDALRAQVAAVLQARDEAENHDE